MTWSRGYIRAIYLRGTDLRCDRMQATKDMVMQINCILQDAKRVNNNHHC